MGKYNKDGIPKEPKGAQKVDITFKIDSDGILKVTTQALHDNSTKEMEIQAENMNLRQDEVE